MDKFFTITELSCEDFADYLPEEDYKKLTDDQMRECASRIADAIMETGIYWDCIEKFSYEIKNNL